MIVLDGKLLSSKIKDEIKAKADSFKQTPILCVITIGNNDASEVYIKNKRLACEYTGISLLHIRYEDGVSEEKVIKRINELNKDKSINGIILQLPIPEKYNQYRILNAISYLKDVDGLTEISQGKLINDNSLFVPCTPKGILEIFDHYNIELEGKHVVIVGRSNLVSKPLLIECLKRNATVSMCHSKTRNLEKYTKEADILVVATGKKYLINKDMVKDGVIIIDVGITRENGKLYGDVNPDVDSKAYAKTPVPGGVGPMTVCMLLKNTMIAYYEQNGIKEV